MRLSLFAFLMAVLCISPARAEMTDFPVIKLQSLDKASARTMTFEARVGSTVKFGPIYIKIQSCRKAPPMEQPESAAFLQIWEVTPRGKSEWIYSGWMFASSPALSPMDHPIYDVWVLDCLERKSDDPVPEKPAVTTEPAAETTEDGEVTGVAAEPPEADPQKPVVTMPAPDESSSDEPKTDGPTVTFPDMQ
jgi:hypothetical protein